MAFSIGDLVDLYDFGFRQWRGEYTVIKLPHETGGTLYKIRNTKMGSQQFVKEKALRRSRLGPFRIESLQP
jgi:hypothetical protein